MRPVRTVPEQPCHRNGISKLLRDAFGGPLEAELVVQLHADADTIVSLVALDEADDVVGHVLFSRLICKLEGAALAAAALAPLAVREDCRRQGLGTRLVSGGLEACRQAGRDIVVVVGDPAYYERFGFSTSAASRLTSPFAGPHAMALSFPPALLAGRHGTIEYARAFQRFWP